MLVKWANVAVGTHVSLAGRDYRLAEAVPKKKGRLIEVTVEGSFGTHTHRVEATDEVEVVLSRKERLTGGSKPQRETLRREVKGNLKEGRKAREAAAAGTWEPDEVDVAYVKKMAKKLAKKSAKMKAARAVAVEVAKPSRGEKVVTGLMQAVPIATVKLKGEYVLDLPTPSTIESHLYLFHNAETGSASWPTTYADQVAMHERLHEEGDAVPFHRHPGMKEPKR